jgi:uncharacterized membrane protein YdjX (TVP38/TMEM64 family)
MDALISVREIADWLASFGIWAVLISLLLSIIVSVIGVIPPVFMSAANAIVFGIWPGLLISLAGETIGASVSYWVYKRILLRLEWSRVAQRFPLVKPGQWRWLIKLQQVSTRRQLLMLFIGYMTPFMPAFLVTLAASAANVRFLWFVPIVFIGKIPSLTLETVIAHDVIFLTDNWSRLLISVSMLLVLVWLFKRSTAANS